MKCLKKVSINVTTECSENSCYFGTKHCKFLSTIRYGTIDFCGLYNVALSIGDQEDGYPVLRCEQCLEEHK